MKAYWQAKPFSGKIEMIKEALQGVDHRKEETWIAANPAYGDLNSKADFESMVKRTPEAEFATYDYSGNRYRCNQWVSSKTAWLPAGVWDGLRAVVDVPVDADIVLEKLGKVQKGLAEWNDWTGRQGSYGRKMSWRWLRYGVLS